MFILNLSELTLAQVSLAWPHLPGKGGQSSTWAELWAVCEKNCGISWAVSSCLHGTAVCYEASCDWGMQQEDESGRKALQHLVQDRHMVSELGSAAFPAFSPMVCSVSSLAPTLIINWGLVSHFCSCKCHCSCLHPWVCMLRMTQQGHSGNLLQILTRFVHVSRYISRG